MAIDGAGERPGLVGLVLPEVDVPYFAELARRLSAELTAAGYRMVVEHTAGDRDREHDAVVRGAAEFTGMIINPLTVESAELAALGVPVVLIGEQADSTVFDHVLIDNVRAAQEAVAHLVGSGRRRIAIIGGEAGDRYQTTALRLEGCWLALQEAGLQCPRQLNIRTRGLHRDDGAAAMARLLLLRNPPDAVVCLNDLVAIGALRALAVAGVRVPEDVAVTGFDDIAEGEFSNPTLSTVAPDKDQLARVVARRLVSRMAGESGPGQTLITEHRFLARESTLGRSVGSAGRRSMLSAGGIDPS